MKLTKIIIWLIIIVSINSCKNELGYRPNDHVNMINRILSEEMVFSDRLLLNYDSTDIILDNLFIIDDEFTEFETFQNDSVFEITYHGFIYDNPLMHKIFGDAKSIEPFDPNEDFSLLSETIKHVSIYDLMWTDSKNDTIRELDFTSTLSKYNSTGFILVSKPLFDENCDTAILCMDILTRDHYINNLFFLKRNSDSWEIIKKEFDVFKILKFYTGVDKDNLITGKGFKLVYLGFEGLHIYSLPEKENVKPAHNKG